MCVSGPAFCSLAKRIASISMARIEDIGELGGKKSLFEDILVFSKLERTRRLSFRFSSPQESFSQFKGKVNYRFECGFTL